MKPKTSRRKFLEGLAVGAAAPLLGASAESHAGDTPLTPAQLLAELAQRRFGEHLNDEQRRQVAAKIAQNLQATAALGRVSLENADEPCTVFIADIAE
jgi:hypothetical protein